MDLTFQVPMQYCSLQHWTSLPSPVTSTTGCCFALAQPLHSFWSYFSSLLHGRLSKLMFCGGMVAEIFYSDILRCHCPSTISTWSKVRDLVKISYSAVWLMSLSLNNFCLDQSWRLMFGLLDLGKEQGQKVNQQLLCQCR